MPRLGPRSRTPVAGSPGLWPCCPSCGAGVSSSLLLHGRIPKEKHSKGEKSPKNIKPQNCLPWMVSIFSLAADRSACWGPSGADASSAWPTRGCGDGLHARKPLCLVLVPSVCLNSPSLTVLFLFQKTHLFLLLSDQLHSPVDTLDGSAGPVSGRPAPPAPGPGRPPSGASR